jgi:phytoene synthase
MMNLARENRRISRARYRPSDSRSETLELAREEVRERLKKATVSLSSEGFPQPDLDGKLLRPLAAYITVPRETRVRLDDRFWFGALAIEMVHEASLLHDDILDEAPERRGKPTMVAAAGVGPALVLGDHLLTAAYRAAAATESPEFLSVFIRSVERTVAGEVAQEASQGRILGEAEYLRIISGKSGELFRSAFLLAPAILEKESADAVGSLGARFGALYQMVDDFLDYCPDGDRGKSPLQDYRQKKWTWPLGLTQASHFEDPESTVLLRLFRRTEGGGQAPMEKGAERFRGEVESLLRDLAGEGVETLELSELLWGWSRLIQDTAVEEVQTQGIVPPMHRRDSFLEGSGSHSRRPEAAALRRELRLAAGDLASSGERLTYFGRHAKSFRFAARLFPGEQLQKVADVYTFCRFTDDLVDEAVGEAPEVTETRLNVWLSLARQAYEEGDSGVPMLEAVMGEMRAAGVPFSYAAELVEGVRMDLSPRRYRTKEELRTYSHRVASVVGGWLTELFGIRDPWILNRAFALGHAMQLTNILRDVGEDLRRGRLYLPEDLMASYGIDRDHLEAKAKSGSPAVPGYRRLLEALMADAESDYEMAFEAIPTLPSFFQGPVAVAASVYRGIHDEIRRNGYDNLNRRARTSLSRKLVLGAQGLWSLKRSSTRQGRAGHERAIPLQPFGRDEERQAAS